MSCSQLSLRHSRSSVLVSHVQRSLVQTFTIIIWCEGVALAISTWVFLFCHLGTLAVSVLGCWKTSLYHKVSYCAESLLSFGTALLAKERHNHAILLTWCRCMKLANVSASKISTIFRQCHTATITQMVMDGLCCPLCNVTWSKHGQRPCLLVLLIVPYIY